MAPGEWRMKPHYFATASEGSCDMPKVGDFHVTVNPFQQARVATMLNFFFFCIGRGGANTDLDEAPAAIGIDRAVPVVSVPEHRGRLNEHWTTSGVDLGSRLTPRGVRGVLT